MEEFLRLTADEQERLYKRLVRHALRKMMRLKWRGAYIAHGGAVPKGYEPSDLVNDALMKAMDGRRKWNKAVSPNLEQFLCSIINSDVNHLASSVDNAMGRRQLSSTNDPVITYEVPDTTPDTLLVVLDREWQHRFDAAAAKELNGDAFLTELLDCIKNGITEPGEIAIMMGKSVDEVNNAKKRLQRRLNALDSRTKPPKRRTRS